jgi:aspartate/methionine/tyrosine aminotransferase
VLVLMNPHNPLGSIYDPAILWKILEFCKEKSIHVVIDEVYRLSIHQGELSEFVSVLSYGSNVPDPDRTHFIWSMSKDFALSGFRVGVLYSLSNIVSEALSKYAYFKCCPTIVQLTLGRLLSDFTWIDQTFIPTNIKRLRANYKSMVAGLSSLDLKTHSKTKAGLFIWAYLGHHLKEKTFAEEQKFTEFLLNESGVYVVPGSELASPVSEPGWVRIVFAIPPKQVQIFLQRLKKALLNYKQQ